MAAKYYISPGVVVKKNTLGGNLEHRENFDKIIEEIVESVTLDLSSYLRTTSIGVTGITGTTFNFAHSQTTGNYRLSATSGSLTLGTLHATTPGSVILSRTTTGDIQTDISLQPILGRESVHLGVVDLADATKITTFLMSDQVISSVLSPDGNVFNQFTVAPTGSTITYGSVSTPATNSEVTLAASSALLRAATATLSAPIDGNKKHDVVVKTSNVTITSSADTAVSSTQTILSDTAIELKFVDSVTPANSAVVKAESGIVTITATSILTGLPTHADEAAAIIAGLVKNQLYKTATGEVRIKL